MTRILCSLLLGLVCLPAFAHSSMDTRHKNVASTSAAPHCHEPSVRCAQTVTVAADHQDRLWRAFVNGRTLYVQKRLAEGRYAPPLPVNAEPENIANQGEDRPQLAFGPDGEIYLAWTQQLPTNWAGHIRFSRSLDGGRHFSTPITINLDRHAIIHRFPVMKTNADGDIFIAWIDARDRLAGSGDELPHDAGAIYYTWSDDRGAHFAPRNLRLASAVCGCCRLAMTVRDGLPEVFFRKVFPHSERDHARVLFKAPDKPAPLQRISFDRWQLQGCPHQGPAALYAAGRTHFLWYDKGQLYYRQAINGRLSPVSPVGRKGSEHPDLASADGVLYRVWRRYTDGAMHVWLQTSRDQGGRWSDATSVASTAGASDYPQLVSNGSQVWLSWQTREDGYQLLPVSAHPPEKTAP